MAKSAPSAKKYSKAWYQQELHYYGAELRATKENLQCATSENDGLHKQLAIFKADERQLDRELTHQKEMLNHLSSDYTAVIKDRNELRSRILDLQLGGLTFWQTLAILVKKLFKRKKK